MFMKREVPPINHFLTPHETSTARIQARHSYRWDDVVWHHTFAPCVTRKERPDNPRMSDGCVIDFSKFHDLVPVQVRA